MLWDIFKDVCPEGAADLYFANRVCKLAGICSIVCSAAAIVLCVAMCATESIAMSAVAEVLAIVTGTVGLALVVLYFFARYLIRKQCKSFGVDMGTIPLFLKDYPPKGVA